MAILRDVIDAHFHLFPPQFTSEAQELHNSHRGLTPTEAIKMLDTAHVSQAIVFGHPDIRVISAVDSNRYVLRAARENGDRLIPFGIIGEDAEEWLTRGMRGFKEHSFGQRRMWEDREHKLPADPAAWCHQYQVLAKAGVPLVGHFGRDVIGRVNRIRKSCPDLIIVVAQLGWHFEYGRRPEQSYVTKVLTELGRIPYVFFDLSALDSRDNDLVRMACELVGSRRILFGSDGVTESMNPSTALTWFTSIDLGEEQTQDILFGTAKDILGRHDHKRMRKTEIFDE
jgi:predicted TIM-barrel fold metal-dependent hydrolase